VDNNLLISDFFKNYVHVVRAVYEIFNPSIKDQCINSVILLKHWWSLFTKKVTRKTNEQTRQTDNRIYEGRSINKLQNGVILLIFTLWKFRNIRFVADLILSTSCEFYCDNVTATSFIGTRYGNVAVEIIQQATAFCYSFAVGKTT